MKITRKVISKSKHNTEEVVYHISNGKTIKSVTKHEIIGYKYPIPH